MNLPFVTVTDARASELLPLHPKTVRVFLVFEEARADGTTKPLPMPSPLPAP